MKISRRLIALALALTCTASVASAQQPDTTAAAVARRPMLERAIRQRWLAVVRNRLQLSDAQLKRLMETSRHFGQQRQALNQEERGIRQEMRAQLTGTVPADDKRLGTLIDSILEIQRQRLQVTQAEQKELAMYLTPLQRVRFLALQEQLRNRMEQIRAARPAGRFGAGAVQDTSGEF